VDRSFRVFARLNGTEAKNFAIESGDAAVDEHRFGGILSTKYVSESTAIRVKKAIHVRR
jgi:hypothetical protein